MHGGQVPVRCDPDVGIACYYLLASVSDWKSTTSFFLKQLMDRIGISLPKGPEFDRMSRKPSPPVAFGFHQDQSTEYKQRELSNQLLYPLIKRSLATESILNHPISRRLHGTEHSFPSSKFPCRQTRVYLAPTVRAKHRFHTLCLASPMRQTDEANRPGNEADLQPCDRRTALAAPGRVQPSMMTIRLNKGPVNLQQQQDASSHHAVGSQTMSSTYCDHPRGRDGRSSCSLLFPRTWTPEMSTGAVPKV